MRHAGLPKGIGPWNSFFRSILAGKLSEHPGPVKLREGQCYVINRSESHSGIFE